MSAVTLETLKADFEGSWTAVDFGAEHCFDLLEGLFANGEVCRRSTDGFLGFIYLIARDYGLQAAMLFKLSDGAIDPRKAGGA